MINTPNIQLLPLYAQLKSTLIEEIRAGNFKPGAQIPSQRDLIARFAMSHMTVRRALNDLVSDGILIAIPGKGIFVSSNEKQQAESGPFVSFSEEMTRRGLRPSSRILDQGWVRANPALASIFCVLMGEQLILLRRLRLADDAPIALQTAYLPAARFPGLLEFNFETASLYATLRDHYGVIFADSRSSVEAVLANAEDADLLDLPMPSALLVIEQTTHDDSGRAIEFIRSAYRGDRFKIHGAAEKL